MSSDTNASQRALAVGLVLLGLLGQDVGASFAVLLFPSVGALGMVTLRLAFSAIVLLVLFRPSLRGYSRSDWVTVTAFGLVLAAMNVTFYQAIARIPLGATVTLEVIGPLLLSVATNRRAVSWLWAALAFAGVALLGGGALGALDPVGVLFTAIASTMWVCYILLSARTGTVFPRLDGLAVAMTIGAVVVVPFGVASAGPALFTPNVLLIGLGVAALSSTIPYALELLALRRLPAATFSVMMSLSPAIAALAGLLLLGQPITAVGSVAIALVVVATAGAVATSAKAPGIRVPHNGSLPPAP